MDDELYGRVRGFLAAMEALNNGQPDTAEFVGFLFDRLPDVQTPDGALVGYVYDGGRSTFLGTEAPLPVLNGLTDWRVAVGAAVEELFFLLLRPVPVTVEGGHTASSKAQLTADFLNLLAETLADGPSLVWSVSWRYADGRDAGSWFCHVRAYEYVFETADGERFLLALGHDD